MGVADRMIRTTLAGVFLALYGSGKVLGGSGRLLIGLSGIFLITSFLGTCPVYQVLDISTIEKIEIIGDL